MALVDYSDSASDGDAPEAEAATPQATAAGPAFHAAAPGKIRVALPALAPEAGQTDAAGADGRPAKRARTGAALSGFNRLLPAPKRTAPHAPTPGVGLKTSSEAAFSREAPPAPPAPEQACSAPASSGGAEVSGARAGPAAEPTLVGKATRFLPLSVSNRNRKKRLGKPPPLAERKESTAGVAGQQSSMAPAVAASVAAKAEPMPPPKRSLFSVQQEEEDPPPRRSSTGEYEPLARPPDGRAYLPGEAPAQAAPQTSDAPVNPNSLEAVAADLHLTPAQRRQLFGRHGKDAHISAHFNMDSEYRHNEQLRQAGEVVEHRAIKSIAPGKHSLQQLVNNAKTQQDAMEDKWAEGRKNRGEGGSKYGWSG